MKNKFPSCLIKGLILIVTLILILLAWLWQSDLETDYLIDKYTNSESKFVAVNGMNVHYRIQGSGDTILLLHGTAASLHTWEAWVDLLASDFTIVTMDLPAFGLTGPDPDRDYSAENYAQFLYAFSKKLNLEKFHLGGNSLGGKIAWYYAAKYPDQVKNLILVDPSGVPNDEEVPDVFKLAQNPIIGNLLTKVSLKSLVEKSLKEVYHDDSKIEKDLIDRYYELSLRKGNRQAFVDRARTPEVDYTELLANIQSPTLVMWGENDLWCSIKDTTVYRKEINNVTIISYPKVGHLPMEEIPQKSAEDILKFINK